MPVMKGCATEPRPDIHGPVADSAGGGGAGWLCGSDGRGLASMA